MMFSSVISVLPNIVLLVCGNTPDILTYQGVTPLSSTSDLEWSFLFPFYTFYHLTLLGLKCRRYDSVKGLL